MAWVRSYGKSRFTFPVGYERFHKRQLFNFQLNRPYSFGYAKSADMKEAGRKIKTFTDWKREMLLLAEKAISEERVMNAAFCYRAAEFYIKSNDPEKVVLYDKFIDLFYKAFKNDDLEKVNIPYGDAFLTAIKIPSVAEKKGTIVIHGGFDSFIEEFYSMMRYFSNHGYEAIGFEGPGQGATLRKFGIPITYEWEKPTKTILDYFHLEDVTMIGISMGGWLCLRASAFESRIKRVIATGHAIDYMKSMPPLFRKIHLWCMEHCRNFMNRMAVMKFEKREGMAPWVVDHLKYITKKTKPLDALEIYMQMNEENIHSELVKQDVLILTGKKDHFIPFKMHDMQLKALVNAKSVTGRIFTEKEHAQNHCQTGNIELALKTMIDWIERI
ncbi:MAG: alpha/beta fold hydrolase [Acidobacteria bacterium]|jgi:esterase/lipase|nr:alpha/beta fold hydrolase [Acidobacteriota bacterium]